MPSGNGTQALATVGSGTAVVAPVLTVSVAAIAFLYGVLVVEHVLAGQFYALLAVATYLFWGRVRDLAPGRGANRP